MSWGPRYILAGFVILMAWNPPPAFAGAGTASPSPVPVTAATTQPGHRFIATDGPPTGRPVICVTGRCAGLVSL